MIHLDLHRTIRWTALALVAATLPVLAGASASDVANAAPVEPIPDLLSTTGGGTLDESLVKGLDSGDRLTFNVAPGTDVVATVDKRTTDDAYNSWTGTLTDGGFFTVVQAGQAVRVHVASPSGTYEITQDQGSSAKVVEVLPEKHVEKAHQKNDFLVPPAAERRAARTSAAGGDSGAVIDMLIAFTPQAVAEAGGNDQAVAAAATVIAQTNLSFTNSQIPVQVRLVGTAVTAQNQSSTDIDTELDALTSTNDGIYDELHTLREQYHADQVSLLEGSNTATACGVGWLGGRETRAFTVTELRCVSTYATTHELGHNLGAEHDRYPGVSNSGKIAPDAAGLVNVAGKWITVMSYWNSCDDAGVDCARVPYFSNPAVSYAGAPTGTATANNARVITVNAPVVANFRQEQIYAGVPTLAGRARYRSTLTVSSTPWSPAHVAVGYQWYVDGQPIAGATGTKFTPPLTYIGHSVTVSLTGNAPYYPAVGVSSAPVTVAKARFRAKRPVLKGTPRAGRVLSVKLKRFKPKKRTKVRYSWYRNGKKIKGAKKRAYRLRRKDRKHKVWSVVTLRKKGYTTAKLSTRKRKIKR